MVLTLMARKPEADRFYKAFYVFRLASIDANIFIILINDRLLFTVLKLSGHPERTTDYF